MNELVILCVEDEPTVRSVLVRDASAFSPPFCIEEVEDAAEAREVVAQCSRAGDRIALVLCDHLLPGESGVDFLVALNADPGTRAARKVLVTGQAGHADTIKAVNDAGLDYYIAKPWTRDELQRVVRDQLTDYVIQHADNLLPYVATLDGARLMRARGMSNSE